LDDVRGLHVNWTLPRKLRNIARVGPERLMAPDEIITAIHSALSWTEFHGPIDMFTDDAGAAWMERAGLADLYRRIEVDPLQSLDPRIIDPLVYPTLGKILVLEFASCPVAVFDTDFYLKRPAPGLRNGDQFVFTHVESVDNYVYPPAAQVPDVNGVIDPAWDFGIPAANTSFAFFASDRHREACVSKALAYASRNNRKSDLYAWVRPCFAEQRVSIFEARRLRVSYRPLIGATWSPVERSWSSPPVGDLYHHTWYETDRIVSDASFARRFVDAQIAALLRRFPDAEARVLKLKDLGWLEVPTDAAITSGV
jgi:hypothetical protein